jgi:hypothetical protein
VGELSLELPIAMYIVFLIYTFPVSLIIFQKENTNKKMRILLADNLVNKLNVIYPVYVSEAKPIKIISGGIIMYNSVYLTNVTRQLERLLVFKQVFNEYIHTCENIICGNCLASENIGNLRNYFTRNLVRFRPFLDEIRNIHVPAKYDRLHADILFSIEAYDRAISNLMDAMHGDRLNQTQFGLAKTDQERALSSIDSVFIDRLRIANGELCG